MKVAQKEQMFFEQAHKRYLGAPQNRECKQKSSVA
jgi:hypothetical protein